MHFRRVANYTQKDPASNSYFQGKIFGNAHAIVAGVEFLLFGAGGAVVGVGGDGCRRRWGKDGRT